MKKFLLFIFATVFCLTMNAKVVLDFSNAASDWGIPQSTSSGSHYYEETAYTNGTYTISLGAPTSSGNGYYYNSGGYLMLCEVDAYMKLPIFDFAVGTIVVEGHSGGSSTATMNIFVDDTAVSTEATDTGADHTYVINANYQTIGTQYIYKNTSSKNLQVVSITIYEVGEDVDDGGGDNPTGHGYEPDDPYTVSELIPIIEALSSGGTITNVYVKGFVSYIEEISLSYGNMTYYISDDGTTTNQLLIYRGKSLNGASPATEEEIQDGDEVVVYGTFTNYSGNTPEGSSGATQLYSINGKTSGDGGSGSGVNTSTADNPYTVAELIPLISALSAGGTIEGVYVKGIISQIDEISTSYGNATYYISDDGTTDNQLCIYRGYSLNNEAFTSEDEIVVGDVVVVHGTFTNYSGNTPEGATGQTYIYSLNGVTTEEPTPPGSTEGVTITNTTITLTNEALTASDEEVEINFSELGYENETVVDGDPITLDEYTTLTFAIADGTTTPKYYDVNTAIRMYADNTLTITSTKKVAKVVLNCASGYTGNDIAIASFEDNEIVYCNYYTQNSGGTQVRCQTLVVTYALDSDDPSGITTVTVKDAYNGIRYNLSGQKVSESYKGIVIVDGKKYLAK